MEVGEHLFKFAEEQRLLIGWHVAKVGQGRDELLGELLAGQCDVVLVDRDGRPHRLVQGVLLVVSAYEVVKCHKRIALPESLKDGGNLPTHLPVGDWHAFHEGLNTVTDALVAKARKPSPGVERVNELTSDPRFAAGVPRAPLSPDAAYIGLVLPIDVRAGRLVDDDDALPPGTADDDDGLDGNS